MKNDRLTPRRQYEVAYCHLRLYSGHYATDVLYGIKDEIVDCAVLSFDTRHDNFTGWITRRRHATFLHGKRYEINPQELGF